MLPVSDMLEVARQRVTPAEVGARAPQRFAPDISAPVIVWNICRHCNMSCPHCYAGAAFRPSSDDLDTEEALRLLDDLASCGVRIVIFSGGEPLLRDDLVELATHARRIGIAPQLSTNGVFIDEACADRLAEAGFAYVGISIDGIPAFNDEYRGLQGGHEAAVRGLRFAKAAGMRTGLRMTLTARNFEQIDAMLALACEVRADRFYVSHLLYSGRGRKMAAEDVGQEHVRALLFGLFSAAEGMLVDAAETRIVTGSNDSDGPLLLRWIESQYGANAATPVRVLLSERGGNSAGEKILNIDHRGHVHPDQFWRQETLGDVRRDAFKDILEHPMRTLLADRSGYLKGRCGACKYRALCRGSHRERALADGGELWDPDPACVLEDSEIGVST
ncbi:MAG: radical SAM protein [bacterium]|nr:radical SAM protein [bacterium]